MTRRQVRFKDIDRLHILSGAFFLLALGIVVRLFNLQILDGSIRQAEAYGQRAFSRELLPERGEVYTISSIHSQDELQPLAVNEKRYLIYANPSEITQPVNTARALAEILEIEEEPLEAKLRKEKDPYEPIKGEVLQEVADIIDELELAGIYREDQMVRTYPMKNAFSHITGFLGYSEEGRAGQYGIEGFLDRLLAGESGYLESEQDPSGRLIALGDRQLVPAIDGTDFILTLDPNIQQRVCEIIKNTVDLYKATGGSVIVMQPDTGAVRAMCSVPDFDPNNYGAVEDIDVFVNPAVTGTYEPGSIFKPITMAAALDSGRVKPDTVYEDTGSIVIGPNTIKNAENRVYGKQTMSQVLENSINTGSVFAAMETGRRTFQKYVEEFGFGKKTGIEFPAESPGNLNSLNEKSDIFLATGSFGQGITVTPIQMVKAFATIANQGKSVQPHVIDRVITPQGVEIPMQPEEGEQVISTQTAAVLSAMLVNVIEEGYGDSAGLPGFYLAGKTGTAQIAGRKGYSEDTIHSFIGFGPISDPQFVVLVKLDRPQWGQYSANTVAPVFGDIANFLVQYYQIPPER